MSLIEDAKAAKKAGMNYGVWKSLQPVIPYEKKSPHVKVCKNCGGVMSGKRLEYCCNECRNEMKRKTNMGDTYV